MSTTSTAGQPLRSAFRLGVTSGPQPRASRLGHGETSRTGMPARRPRSIATSRACQAGIRSSFKASSCSSITTITAGSATGAHAAARAPIVTPAPAAACGPVAGHDRDADPRSPDATGEAASHVDRRSHDERGSEARRGEHDRQMIDGRRHPHDRTGLIEHAGREVGILPPRRHGAHERRRQPGHERGRRRRDEERGCPPEPPLRRPARQRHDISGRTETTHAEQVGEDDTCRWLDVDLDHPARDSAAVQRHAHE